METAAGNDPLLGLRGQQSAPASKKSEGAPCASLFGGRPEEARQAILRCGELSASWERTAFARQLTQSTAHRADLAGHVAALQQALHDAQTGQS